MIKEGENLDDFLGKSSRVSPICNDLTQDKLCRICMEPESADLNLISPCKCSGTVKYIHEECLKTWIVSQEGDIDDGQCEICKTEFLMNFKIGRKCEPKESIKNGMTPILYLPILIVVMIMLFLIIFLLAYKFINISDKPGEVGYTVALMITCGVSGLILLMLVISTLKEICFVAKLDEWHIYNQLFEEDDQFKDETMIQDRGLGSVLIVPENLIVKGVKIKTPFINPNLAPLNQRGRLVGFAPRALSPDFQRPPSVSIPFRVNTDPYCLNDIR